MSSGRERGAAPADVTIDHVARAAGVSKATVSRVFRSPEVVAERTRAAVLAAAEELEYLPARRGPAAHSQRTGTIGLIVPDIVNPFFPPMIKAVHRRARARDFEVYLSDSDTRPMEEAEAAASLAKQVDGLILWSSRLSQAELEDIAGQVPAVLVNNGVPGVPTVTIDNANGMRQAVEHLYALGHQDCAYVNAPRTTWSNRPRRAAVRAACKALGMRLLELGPFADTYEGGVQAADVIAASGVTAAIASNDLTAIGVLQQLVKRGIDVPGDISVVGVDDTLVASLVRPELTTVRIPVDEIGTLAVDLLLDVLRCGEAQAPAEIATDLIVRNSTGPAPARVTWPVRPIPSVRED